MLLADFFDDVRTWFSLPREVYGSSAGQWALAAGVFVLLLLVLWIVKTTVARRIEKLAARTATHWDDALAAALRATTFWFLVILAACLALMTLSLPGEARRVIDSIAIVALLVQAALWANVLITASVSRYIAQRGEADGELATTVAAVSFLARLVLWAVVAILVLDNLGVNITTLIAGLGIGGIAVALAAQNILGDLFASLSIVLDKPFVLGDMIAVGAEMGTVERIGLKSTRLRSPSGEQLIVSNTDLLKSRIRNLKRMYQRRVPFTLGVAYGTPGEKLAAIPQMVREIVESAASTRFDRCHFKEYGDSALVFEIVYFVLSPDFDLYMDIQQSVNLAIYDRFAQQGIEFAFPTRTVWLRQAGAGDDGVQLH